MVNGKRMLAGRMLAGWGDVGSTSRSNIAVKEIDVRREHENLLGDRVEGKGFGINEELAREKKNYVLSKEVEYRADSSTIMSAPPLGGK